jgi:uncharacterized protein (DUF1697 family)
MAGRYVALLRGINVGGKNLLPMKVLAAMFDAAGCSDVTTFIQSGNVIFGATEKLAAKLAHDISKRIAKQCGLDVPVIVRSAEELERVAKVNPFVKRGADPEHFHVVFLADRPTAKQIALLDSKRSPPDEFEVIGQEIYLCCPNGMGRSKLTNAYFDSKLSTVSSVRNWRTVGKLIELSR